MEQTTKSTGTLYGVGVGPGDPELLTLKAVRVLKGVRHVFAACSSANEYSIALDIVREHIEERGVTRLDFPMTRDKKILNNAWTRNAKTVLKVLESGEDAAFITLGDPLTYSTFGPLMRHVKGLNPNVNIVSVPGITSYHAAAARLNMTIAEGERGFYVVSGVNGGGPIEDAVKKADTVFVLKTYKKFPHIKEVVKGMGLEKEALLVSRLGLSGERLICGIEGVGDETRLPYLTLMVLRANAGATDKSLGDGQGQDGKET